MDTGQPLVSPTLHLTPKKSYATRFFVQPLNNTTLNANSDCYNAFKYTLLDGVDLGFISPKPKPCEFVGKRVQSMFLFVLLPRGEYTIRDIWTSLSISQLLQKKNKKKHLLLHR